MLKTVKMKNFNEAEVLPNVSVVKTMDNIDILTYYQEYAFTLYY